MTEQNEGKPNIVCYGGNVVARILWIVIRIVAIVWVGKQGAHFLYQGF